MRTLSKSKILSYRQCHKRLWLEVHRPELREDSSSTQAVFNVGHQVGDLARTLYDPENKGTLIDVKADGFAAAFERTASLITTKQPIFEAAFTAGGALALADMMLPLNKRGKPRWKMVEVKSSTSVKDYYRDDVALQSYVAKSSGVDLHEIAIACIDSSWVYPGKSDYQGLLAETDLTAEAFGREQEVKGWIQESQAIVARTSEPAIETGKHCDQPYPCGFYGYCTKDYAVVEQPITWLPHIRTNALKSVIEENGLVEIKDAPDEHLNELQLRVKQCTLNGKTYFDKAGARQDLSVYKLPAYFIDFETIQFAVPIWKGTRPYQQIPYQYSLHKLNRNGALTHTSFLDLSGNDPSKSFAESLLRDCGKADPVYVYNAGFETVRIKELALRFPKLKQELLAINDRVVDLLPITRQRYYHPSQGGSWSIKKVLPAIAADLSYADLKGVQDGGMATDAYLEAIAVITTKERQAEIEQQLLKYCELDTFAMFRLWQFFSGVAT
jgi:Domain of unknown function(DUF2779)